jgi:hypothetical protein
MVEYVREGRLTRQNIIRNLGRKETVLAAGDLDRLMASIGRFSESTIFLSAIDTNPAEVNVRRIGGPLLFRGLWERLGIDAVLAEALEGRQFGFAVERAVFVASLQRLFVSGSDRSCVDCAVMPETGLRPFRSITSTVLWPGSVRNPKRRLKAQQALAPRCMKDVIEEKLFARQRYTGAQRLFQRSTA